MIADIVEELGGILLAIETRYYGESYVTENLSLDNLRYLVMDNILMDFNRIIIDDFIMPAQFEFDLILVGEDIAGTYATFYRSTYANMNRVHAAIVLGPALHVKTDFPQYYSDIAHTIKSHANGECFRTLESAFLQLVEFIHDGKSNEIHNLLRLNEELDTKNARDVALLFDDFAMNTFGTKFTQTNSDYILNDFVMQLQNQF